MPRWFISEPAVLKLWSLEGHSQQPLPPGPVESTWQMEVVLLQKAGCSRSAGGAAAGVGKGRAGTFRAKGSEGAQLLGGQCHLVTTKAQKHTVEGREKAGPPPWQTGWRKGEGKSAKQNPRAEGQQALRARAPPLPWRGQRASQAGAWGTRGPHSTGSRFPLPRPGSALLSELRNLRTAELGKAKEFSHKARVQTKSRQRYKPCRKPGKKRAIKKNRKPFSRESGVPGPQRYGS